MYNLRYHIASLVSVFIALAVGLVLGGLVVNTGTFEQQSDALVKGLRDEFNKLHDENVALKAENERLEDFSTGFVDTWTAERLAGRTIIVVINSGRQEGLSPAQSAIESAGGSVATVTLLEPGLGLDTPELRDRVTQLAPDAEHPLESISAALAAEWSAPVTGRPLTAALADAGVISISGLAEGTAASGLVTMAAPDGQVDRAGIAFATAVQAANMPALGAQTAEKDTGVAAAAAGAKLGALDTLGSQVGRYTLVALLTGVEPAYYGTAPAASGLFPQVVLR